MFGAALAVLEAQMCFLPPLPTFMSHPRRNHTIRWLQRKSAEAPHSCTSPENVFIECILEGGAAEGGGVKEGSSGLNTREHSTCAAHSNVFQCCCRVFFFF